MADIDTKIQELVDAQAPYIEFQEFGMEFTVPFPDEKCQGIINKLLKVTSASRILQGIAKRQAGAPPYFKLYDLLLPHLNTEWAGKSLNTSQIADTHNIPSDIAEMINQQLLLLRSGANKKRKRKTQRKRKKKKLKRPRSRSFRRKRNTATATRH